MAEKSSGGGFLYFLVGGLVVAVGVLAYMFFVGGGEQTKEINLKVDVPKTDGK